MPLNIFRRPTQTPGTASVRLQALDGMWETVGADRLRGVRAEGLSASANRWGSDTCRFTLRRPPGGVFPDLTAFTPIEIYNQYGTLVWSGRIKETPSASGDEFSIGVEGLGWQYHLDDDVYERTYVHAQLVDWKDCRSQLDVPLSKYRTGPSVQVGDGAITIGWAKGTAITADEWVGVTLDLGPDSTARSIAVELEVVNPSAAFDFYVRGTDTNDGSATGAAFDNFYVNDMNAMTSGWVTGTITTPRRYLTALLHNPATSSTTGSDHLIRLRQIKVFRDPAHRSGNDSVFRAHHGIADALVFAPLLSQDTSLIQETLFNIPDFAMTDDRKPREVMEALNALHNYRLRVRVDRRLEFAPQPDRPLFRIGPWSGADFKDASKNSGDEIFNRSLVKGSGPDGGPLKVNRYASQQAGVLAELVASPAFATPSFDTDAAGWTGAIRVTSVFDTSPGGGYVNLGDVAQSTASGTFRAGQTYLIGLRARGVNVVGNFTVLFGKSIGYFGDGYDDYTATQVTSLGTQFTDVVVAWTPRATTSSASIRIRSFVVDGAFFDSLTIAEPKPTLVDRRRFIRAHVHSMSQAMIPEVGQQIADTFLHTHKRTPLKGDITIKGRHGLRRMQGDATVPPSELLLHTGELVHLSDQIDPDTGALGRDAPIDSVTWVADDDTTSGALDSQRDNLAALLGRYDLVAGSGSG